MSEDNETGTFPVRLGDVVHIPFTECGEYLVIDGRWMLHLNGDTDDEGQEVLGIGDTDWWGMHFAHECVGASEQEQKRYEVLYTLEFEG